MLKMFKYVFGNFIRNTNFINKSLKKKFVTYIVMISINLKTTFSDGYLGSRNDEERSEMRYVMRIAKFSESSNL